METHSPSSDARRIYAIGIGICAVVLIGFALVAAVEPTYAAFGLEDAAPAVLKSQSSVPKIIGNVVKAGLGLVGVVFLILMIYAGIRWMTARGNATFAENAKDTITRAVIGLIIVASAYAITSFVISKVAAGTESSGSSSSSSCVQDKACEAAPDCGGGSCVDNKCQCS